MWKGCMERRIVWRWPSTKKYFLASLQELKENYHALPSTMQNVPHISYQTSKVLVLYSEASVDSINGIALPSKITDEIKFLLQLGQGDISRRGSILAMLSSITHGEDEQDELDFEVDDVNYILEMEGEDDDRDYMQGCYTYYM